MIIAVDIDGILTNEVEGHDYKNRTPNKVAIQKVNILKKQGHYIILYTSRYRRDYFTTKKWLKKHRVLYNKLKMGKPQYDYFIDDKAYNNFEEFFA